MNKLTIAIPSKGRLQENTSDFFGRAGLKILQPGGSRNYRGLIKDLPDVEIAFLSASEIARALADGSVHFGITGLDLVHETIATPETAVHIINPLGFGHADVVIAVPKAWIDVETMSDLGDVASDFRNRHGKRLRVATKYINLTRSFFSAHGIADYRIVESAGATEGAPAAGSAELIVDITSTGSTLEANNLKVLSDGVMLRSQAHLVASLGAQWNDITLATARTVLDQVTAEEQARNNRLVQAYVKDRKAAIKAVASTGAHVLFNTDTGPLTSLVCPKSTVSQCARTLIALGAETVTVQEMDYMFAQENLLFTPLLEKVALS